jgi:hypothetical protein
MQREEKAEKAREAFREQQARAQATKSAREEEYRRMRRSRMNGIHFGFDNGSTHQDHPLACDHGAWWDKVQRRTSCPRCCDMWNYLLQCPGCDTRACPKCQSELRPRFHLNTARTSRRANYCTQRRDIHSSQTRPGPKFSSTIFLRYPTYPTKRRLKVQ